MRARETGGDRGRPQVRCEERRCTGPRARDGSRADPVAAVQRAVGNQAVQRMVDAGAQPTADVGDPDDRYEREADRMAEAVLRTGRRAGGGRTGNGRTEPPVGSASADGLCGRCRRRFEAGKPLDCEECETAVRRREAGSPAPDAGRTAGRQAAGGRAAGGRAAGGRAAGGADGHLRALRGRGRPLPGRVRSFFEPRFGRDFGDVRVHTGPRADEAARSVGAEAFALGRDVVFRSGAYRPGTAAGDELLAHELSHVVQQTGRGPGPSGPVVQRRVAERLVSCTPGQDGVPPDETPIERLRTVDGRAQALASATSMLLTIEAALGAGGEVSAAFQGRFGLPPARDDRFLNRLTGRLHDTQAEAQQREMELVARRFGLVSRTLGQFVRYVCTTRDCGGHRDAWTVTGSGMVALCPTFWDLQDDEMAALLVHEAVHMIWGRIEHGAGGPGGNFRHAECYASLVGDVFGISHGLPACPTPPQVPMEFEPEPP